MAVLVVQSELLSTRFPDKQGKNREFLQNWADERLKIAIIWLISAKFP